MGDSIIALLELIGILLLFVSVLVGIGIMFQYAANISGRRQVVKVNGATLFDAKPQHNYYTPTLPTLSNRTEPKRRSIWDKKLFIYDDISKEMTVKYED